MYEKVPLKTIMILVTTAILIVPWAALQHSHAQSDLANTALAVHNRERAAVGSDPLVWSDELAAEAKTWAEHLVTTGTFEHDTPIFIPTAANPGGKGENIAQGYVGFQTEEQLMQGWADEKKSWNGAPVTDENLYPIGHYVQMVSPASKAVGCAVAQPASAGGPFDLVCRYDRSLFPQEPYIPLFMSQPAQAAGEEDTSFPPADQAVGEEGAGAPPVDQAVGNDGGGGDEGGN